MTMQKVLAGFCAATLLGAGTAYAQTQVQGMGPPLAGVDGATSAGSFPVGPMNVFPGIDIVQGYNDNLLLTPNHTKSTAFTVVSPYVRAEARSGANVFGLKLGLTNAHYWNSSNDNYTNYSALGSADLVFDGRSGLKLNAQFRHGSDPRGTTDRVATSKPDRWNHYGADGVFRYGAPGARGRIEIDAGYFQHRFTNNSATTDGYDYNVWQVGGTFYWRVMPRTEVLVQAQHRDYHYTDSSAPVGAPAGVGVPTASLSSGDNRYYLGLKWEATAKTTGTFKVGYMTKNYDSSARNDSSGMSWEAGVRWSPLTYSVFDLVTSRVYNESTGYGDSIRSNNYGLTWSHAWSSRLRTTALAGYRNDNFLDAAPHRKDDTIVFGGKVNYDFRRWLIFGAEYTHSDRNSNIGAYDYKRNLFQLTIGATL